MKALILPKLRHTPNTVPDRAQQGFLVGKSRLADEIILNLHGKAKEPEQLKPP